MQFRAKSAFCTLAFVSALSGGLVSAQNLSAQPLPPIGGGFVPPPPGGGPGFPGPPPGRRGNNGSGVAAGILGGLAAGAIISGSQPRYYGQPAYVDPDCYYEVQNVWNGYRYVRRNVQVCD